MKFTPLIYALTGETCPENLRKIKELPFEKVLERLSVDETEIILQKIKMRRKKYDKQIQIQPVYLNDVRLMEIEEESGS